MNIVKKVLSTLGGVLLAALLIAALAPKATHGLVAALVQVANTTSSPVPVTDIKDQNPYQDAESLQQTIGNCPFGVSCIVNFKPVPAGYRLVITNASALYVLVAGGTDPFVRLTTTLHPNTFHLLPPPENIGVNLQLVSAPVTFYVEAGDTPQMQLSGKLVVSDGSEDAQATIVGYLVPVP